MAKQPPKRDFASAREKFLGLSLESTRKSYYPQLQEKLEEARKNEQHLQLLIDSLPARIACIDENERYLLINREYTRIFGLARQQIIGRTVAEIIGPDNYRRKHPCLRQAQDGRQVDFEMEFTLPNRERRWNEVSIVPLLEETTPVRSFYILARDITDKKLAEHQRARLEAKLQETEKFQAIGTLAGGIAHDFNNLMMGIQGRISLMLTALGSAHPVSEHLREVEEYIRSATGLTRQLLGFARGGKYETRAVDIVRLVQQTATMFGRTHKELRLHSRLPENPLSVEVDAGQIEQVLLNLLVNAWQAMPAGGTIYLEIKPTLLTEEQVSGHEVDPGAYVKIAVTDTGEGMTEETRRRIFDPFFTTKSRQRGTGLGLASAYGIIQNHRGFITAYSELGRGSTFSVFLPLSDKAAEAVEKAQPEQLQQGNETILLVDDELMIMEVATAMLESLGYQVIQAVGGREALAIVERRGEEIDLMLLDLVMPEIGGSEVFSQVRQHLPDLPVILSSGYSSEGVAEQLISQGCNGFIQKPFSINELSTQIRKVLNANRHGDSN